MRVKVAFGGAIGIIMAVVLASAAGSQVQPPPPPDYISPLVSTLVGRLELDKYKATIKGLTQFGDRREGTERNRDAVAWIEAQLKSYGCSNVERMQYTPPQRGGGAGGGGGQRAGGAAGSGGATSAAGGGAAAGAAG